LEAGAAIECVAWNSVSGHRDPGKSILFYDADCSFCRWCVAKVLAWDRNRLIVPLAITAADSKLLLANIEPDRRLASWHFRDRSGTVFSAGAAVCAAVAAFAWRFAARRVGSALSRRS